MRTTFSLKGTITATIIIAKNKRNLETKKKKSNITIMPIFSDSIVKDIRYNTEKKVGTHFNGWTSEDIKTFIKPTLKQKPDHIIIHIGTTIWEAVGTYKKLQKP